MTNETSVVTAIRLIIPSAPVAALSANNRRRGNVWEQRKATAEALEFAQWFWIGGTNGPMEHHSNDLDWIIVGGESGPAHRPIEAQWVRDIRDQCVEAGVPFFFKQWGGRTSKAGGRELDGRTWDQMPGVGA